MGTTKTQKRYRSNDIVYANRIEPNPRWFETPMGFENRTRLSQETTSYRSSSADDPLSPEARAEFVDVTRNGFTETNPAYDTGHPFFTTKTWNRFSHPNWQSFRWVGPTSREFWRGPLVPFANPGSSLDWYYPAIPRLTTNEINVNGAAMVRATIPTKSSANLATFMGEALQALPSVIGGAFLQDRAGHFHSLGSEYLNVQFGWLPFVSDLKDAVDAVRNSCQIIKQFHRDSGRVVRRKFTADDKVTSSSGTYTPVSGNVNLHGLNNAWDYYYNTPNPNLTLYKPVLWEKISRETFSFSGAYSYYLNMDDSMIGRIERIESEANRLLGTSLTPSVLWELAPWSWLSDWVWNVGDIINNATLLGSDGLVMRYGYLMRHTVAFQRLTIPDGVTLQGQLKTGPISCVFGRETKERVKATPYGFGLDPSGFSAKKWAILAALGMTKGSNVLP